MGEESGCEAASPHTLLDPINSDGDLSSREWTLLIFSVGDKLATPPDSFIHETKLGILILGYATSISTAALHFSGGADAEQTWKRVLCVS